MKARLAAYAGVQLRDFLLLRVPLLVLITGLAMWALFRVTGVTLAAFDPSAGIGGRDRAQLAFEDALGVYGLFAAVFAAQGLVARDRWRGYDRVIFSRALKPARYYLQAFILAGFVVVGLGVVAAGAFAVTIHPVSVPGVAAYIAVAWLTIGSFAFALSTLTGYHLAVVVATIGGALALDRFAAALRVSSAPSGLVEAAQYLLPPAHVIAALRVPFARGRLVPPETLAWPLVFGVLFLVLTVVVLHRRPFRS